MIVLKKRKKVVAPRWNWLKDHKKPVTTVMSVESNLAEVRALSIGYTLV